MKDFMESISFLEFKGQKKEALEHMEKFFSDDKGDVLGYYICKGYDVYKFYIILVNGNLYMALDTLPPCYWYHLDTYEKFKKLKKVYNNKGESFTHRKSLISMELSNNAMSGFMDRVRSDYEYTIFLYNMCTNSPFMHNEIFGEREFYDKYLNRERYNSLEKAILIKHIIDSERGFFIRTALSNSIVSIKCVGRTLFIRCYYNDTPTTLTGHKYPLDVVMFLNNFVVVSLEDIVKTDSGDFFTSIISLLPLAFYGDMRYEIHQYLSDKDMEISKDYEKTLQKVFTDFTVHGVFAKWGNDSKSVDLNDLSNDGIRELLEAEFTEEESKYILKSRLKELHFKQSDTEDKDKKMIKKKK